MSNVVQKQHLKHEYSRHYQPVVSIRMGEIIIVETEDAFNGRLNVSEDVGNLVGPDALPPNPLTGPIYVEDAHPSDTLVVSIDEIELGNRGGTCFARADRSIDTWFDEDFARVYEIENGVIHFSEKLSVPVQPFIGCIATAPAHFSPASVQVSNTGGNMDCCQAKTGSNIYLPVKVEGAYLYLGDVHALQGDGEFCGTAVETNARIKFHIDRIIHHPQKPLSWPRIETPELLVTVACGSSMADANRIAMQEMMNWLEMEYELSPKNIFLELSQVAQFRPCNWFTARCEIPRYFLNI